MYLACTSMHLACTYSFLSSHSYLISHVCHGRPSKTILCFPLGPRVPQLWRMSCLNFPENVSKQDAPWPLTSDLFQDLSSIDKFCMSRLMKAPPDKGLYHISPHRLPNIIITSFTDKFWVNLFGLYLFLKTFNWFIILFRLTDSKPLKPVGSFVSGVQQNIWSLTYINILITQRSNNGIITKAVGGTLLCLNWNDECCVGMNEYHTRLQRNGKHWV